MDESNTNFSMPVMPAYGGGYGSNGGFGFGGDWAWIILLLVLCGGWGNGFGGGFGGGAMPFMMGMDSGFGLYPWMTTNQTVNGGFRDQMIHDAITSVGDKVVFGFGDVATQLCGGFAGVNAGIANAAAQAEISANARQIADLQQMFSLQSQLSQCCCDNKAATADLKYTIATEACNDRAAVSDALRDVMASNSANTQRILDQLCADKIEQKNDTIAQLRQELMFARGQASQDVQTAAIQAGQRGLANEIEQYVLPTPRPAYIVQNPNCCAPNYGCGCGA